MGAWTYVQPRINTAIRYMCDSAGSPTHREVRNLTPQGGCGWGERAITEGRY
jgi:hypothetical protein